MLVNPPPQHRFRQVLVESLQGDNGLPEFIRKAALATNGGKPDGYGAFFPFFGKNVGKTKVVKWVCSSVIAVGTTAFGMDHPLWDSFSTKM